MKNLKQIESFEQFELLTQNDKLTAMIFSAPWCIDCRNVEVYLDETIEDFNDKFDFFYVDYDKFGSLFEKFNVRGIPNFLIFKNGSLVGQIGNGQTIDQDDLEDYFNTLV